MYDERAPQLSGTCRGPWPNSLLLLVQSMGIYQHNGNCAEFTTERQNKRASSFPQQAGFFLTYIWCGRMWVSYVMIHNKQCILYRNIYVLFHHDISTPVWSVVLAELRMVQLKIHIIRYKSTFIKGTCNLQLYSPSQR